MAEPLHIHFVVPTPQEGWRMLKLAQAYGAPGEYERLRNFIGDNLPEEVAETPIEELDFRVRTYNVLFRMDIRTVGALVGYTEAALRENSLVNDAAINDIRKVLQHDYGVGLAGDERQ